MDKKISWRIPAVIVLGLASIWSPLSSAQTGQKWPTQDISIVVPYPPGGGTDLTTRAIAEEMGRALKTTISVINQPGAAGLGNTGVDRGHAFGDGQLVHRQLSVLLGIVLADR